MSGEELTNRAADGSPGNVLALARVAAGLTQREVSDALHLPVTTVAALEIDDKEQLPAHVFTRGYVRAYAKLLELDPDPLVAALSAANQADEDGLNHASLNANDGIIARMMPGLELSKLKQSKLLGGAVAVLVVVLMIWGLASLLGDDTSEAAANEVVQATVKIEETDLIALEADAEVRPDSNTDTDAGATEVPVEHLPEPVAVDTEQVSNIDLRLAGEGVVARRLTELGEDRLSLRFTEECWVEIKNVAGAVLFGDLGRAGGQIELVGTGPFRVLLGYAPGVHLEYNSVAVALAPHTRNNVASLVLGQ